MKEIREQIAKGVVEGDLKIDKSFGEINFPSKLEVKGSFSIYEDAVVSNLPYDYLKVDDHFTVHSKIIKDSPKTLDVGGSFSLKNSPIEKIENIKAFDIFVENTALKEISGKSEAIDILVKDSPLEKIGDNVKIKDYLSVSKTNLTQIPKGVHPKKVLGLYSVRDDKLKSLSTKDFVQFAALVYSRNMLDNVVDTDEHWMPQVSIVEAARNSALPEIKDIAKKANLKINLRDISDSQLQKASKNPKEVAKLLENRIKPTRLASLNKDKLRSNENER